MTRVNFTCCRDGQTCGQGHSTQRVAEASFQLSVKRNVVTDHRNLLLCDGDLLFGWLGIVKGPLRSGLRLRNWGRAMYCTGFWLVSLPRTMILSLAVGSSLMPPESNEDFTLPWVGSAGPGPHRAQVFSKPAETGLRSIARGVRRISPRRRWSTQAEKPAKTSQDDCGDQSTGGHDVCPLLADSTYSPKTCQRQQPACSGRRRGRLRSGYGRSSYRGERRVCVKERALLKGSARVALE